MPKQDKEQTKQVVTKKDRNGDLFIITNNIPGFHPFSIAFKYCGRKTKVPINSQVTLEPGANFFYGTIAESEIERINKHVHLQVVVKNSSQKDVEEATLISSIKNIADPRQLEELYIKENATGKPREAVLIAINETKEKIQKKYESGLNK